jgi:hypothetical protein
MVVRMGPVLQCVRQCGGQVSHTVRSGDRRCSTKVELGRCGPCCDVPRLCQGCTKTAPDAILTGCPLLLQLWSYQRFAIAQPIIDLRPYEQDLYHDGQEDGRTMGTL